MVMCIFREISGCIVLNRVNWRNNDVLIRIKKTVIFCIGWLIVCGVEYFRSRDKGKRI